MPEQVVEFQGLDEVGVPDEPAVAGPHIRERIDGALQLLATLLQRLAGAEHRGIGLHDLLHLEPDLRGGAFAIGVTDPIEP